MPFGSFLENFLSNVSTLPQGLAATNEEPIWTRLTCQRFQTLMRPEPGIMIRAPQLAETESDFGWTLMLLIVLPKQRPPSAVFRGLKSFYGCSLSQLELHWSFVVLPSFEVVRMYAIAALHLEEVNSETTTRYLNLVISLPFVYKSGSMQIGTIVPMLQNGDDGLAQKQCFLCSFKDRWWACRSCSRFPFCVFSPFFYLQF